MCMFVHACVCVILCVCRDLEKDTAKELKQKRDPFRRRRVCYCGRGYWGCTDSLVWVPSVCLFRCFKTEEAMLFKAASDRFGLQREKLEAELDVEQREKRSDPERGNNHKVTNCEDIMTRKPISHTIIGKKNKKQAQLYKRCETETHQP